MKFNKNKATSWIILLFVSGFLDVACCMLLTRRVCDCSSGVPPITLNGTVTGTDDDDIGMTVPCVPDEFNATEFEEKHRFQFVRNLPAEYYYRFVNGGYPLGNLGVETLGGVNTGIFPISAYGYYSSRIFTTCHDGQTTMTIKVLEGGCTSAKDSLQLGRFDLSGIPPAPRGVPQIEVSMKIEGSDIRVHVIAEDKATKKSQSIRAELQHHFSCEQLERLERKANELGEELR